ncbi:transmembrane protein [Perilla frutescens var. frutescens]|nr:transmembrane protein [Perilla frutescens var. frutescens]
MSSKLSPRRRRRVSVPCLLVLIALSTVFGLLMADLRSIDPSPKLQIREKTLEILEKEDFSANSTVSKLEEADAGKKCATVEEMGEIFRRGYVEESLRVRKIIRNHFAVNDPSRIRELTPEQFCNHGFVIGKASEAGLGNELYKILTAAALSVMLNRGKYPFGDYISYSSVSFTLKEVKHLWKQNRCLTKYGRHLTMRIDDFQKPSRTDVLCSNWREWEQPIIWFQNTTDAVAAQFFLKNVHPEMREASSNLFGRPEDLQYRANVFGELMRILISPSKDVEKAVNWALSGRRDPDIALHMRMMMNRSMRAKQAAVDCLRKAIRNLPMISKPKVVLVSDTPSMVNNIALTLEEFAEVLHFDYENFEGNISGNSNKLSIINFRTKDWGPAPRWVAFVDFFLASRAKHAVISGAHRRVGTTYAQLIAALAAAYRLDDNAPLNSSSITFLSSFQGSLLSDGLKRQVGWGHVWNRFAGPLSCRGQPNQCAVTPVLPPGWWDGLWQSPIPRDAQRMEAYGMKLSGFGTLDDSHLNIFCKKRRNSALVAQLI